MNQYLKELHKSSRKINFLEFKLLYFIKTITILILIDLNLFFLVSNVKLEPSKQFCSELFQKYSLIFESGSASFFSFRT